MADQKRIFEQIQDAANYYDAATYDLLTFHNAMFERENDPLASNYVPLTSAFIPNRTQVLPFVIGLLPPSVEVTGRVLDRSASIQASATTIDPFAEVSANPVASTSQPRATGGLYANPPEFYDALVEMCRRHGWIPEEFLKVWANESGLNPGAESPVTHSKGLFQLMPGVAQSPRGFGMTPEQWANYGKLSAAEQVAYAEQFYTKARLPANASRGEVYSKTFLPSAKIEPDGSFSLNGKPLARRGQPTYDVNAGLDRNGDGIISVSDLEDVTNVKLPSNILQSLQRAKEKYEASNPVKAPKGTSKFATTGSQDAKTASTAQKNAANKTQDFNLSQQGQRLMAAQKNIIQAIQVARDQMANTPPLKLLINPESFKVTNRKIISDGNWGRNGAGVGIEHWGDAQDTISASGRVAGFFAVDAGGSSNGSPGNGPGLTRMARNFSASYSNFLSLYLLYRNNGGLWIEDFASGDAKTVKPNNLALMGSVYLYYDNTLYIGSFDSFEMTEEETAPFTLSYSFEFTVRATYLLDRNDAMNPNPGPEFGLPNFPREGVPNQTGTGRAPTVISNPPVPVPANTTITDSASPVRGSSNG